IILPLRGQNQPPQKRKRKRPQASCTTFCLCKTLKELYLLSPSPHSLYIINNVCGGRNAEKHQNFSEAGAKVLTFSEPTKFFGEKISKKNIF
ncbi:MAG: hypothetical protein IKZ83_03745, partial [Prevotella sp.]|nr:hypothetical protein [Prevotella sp.]